jgi:hypothetical protein
MQLYTRARWGCGGRWLGVLAWGSGSPHAAASRAEAQEEVFMAMKRKGTSKAKKKAPAKKKAAKKKK